MTGTTRAEFDARAADARVVPVIRTVFADALTPVGLYRSLAEGRPGGFLLESAEQGGIWSRYSFIGVRSFGVLTESGGSAVWRDTGLAADRAFGGPVPSDPLAALDALSARWESPRDPAHPPLTGGLVGFMGWDAVRRIENLPDAPPSDFPCPELAFAFVSELVVMDHRQGTVDLVVSVLADGADGAAVGTARADELWSDAQRRLDALEHALAAPAAPEPRRIDLSTAPDPRFRSTHEEYLAAVARSKEFIRDGDVFQVVVAQRFDHALEASPLEVYRVLRALNPSPYMYVLTHESDEGEPYAIVGSSPEALVKVVDGRVHMHPIAGSRPRGETPEADQQLAESLLADQKEQAEHLMLVDLARNDLSKVCRAGSVEVTEFMQVERFSHIMHLVSSVEGDQRPEASHVDVFRATFPAGTLSGAPKPRALEIIDELEPARRGVYGGVVGYFSFSGDADLAIAIRTAFLQGGTARVQAGAGLVADSVPETEYQETISKAAAPLRAVAIANALRRAEE
ncbi:anthranilate synthase component I [Microcella daejeonensis]|uniref:Anthranilate synthase component 1 n=1 Tax=Microcella daejeonensis TaxID=2994971 RepID=A0A9E8MKH6_9MICO|nr:anthranilate synthase component I [Microcella daejeonensis]WAB81213.1 anthranilate synthase component I [Microcella daejeonensis]